MSILIEEVANRRMTGERGLSFPAESIAIPVSCWVVETADLYVVGRAVFAEDAALARIQAVRVGATADAQVGGFADCWSSGSGVVLGDATQMPVAELLSMRGAVA